MATPKPDRIPPPLRGGSPWFVTAPRARRLRTPRPAAEAMATVGRQHAREAGAARTACGELVRGWELFWELRFPDGAVNPCPECFAAFTRWRDQLPHGSRATG